MKNIIKELAQKANLPLINDEFMTASQEKFAELIIRECAQHAVNTDLEDVDGGDSEVLQAARRYILEQFGIKHDT